MCTKFDMERHICVRFLWCVVIILVTVQLVHTECPPNGTPDTQVAQMCTNSTVSGNVLYVNTSGASAVNETGTLCVCNVSVSASSGDDLSVTIEGHNVSCGARIVLANTTNNFKTDADNCTLTNHTVMVPTDDLITIVVEKLKEPYDAQFCAKYETVGSSEVIRIKCFESDRLAETATTQPATTVTATTDVAPHTDTTSQTTLTTTVTISSTASQMTETTPSAATTPPTNTIQTTSKTPPISMITLTTDTTATLSATAQSISTTPTNTIQTTSETPPTSMATSTTDTPTAPSAITISVVTSSSSTEDQTFSNTTIKEELLGDGTSGKVATFRISYISVLVVLVSLAVAV